MGAYIDFSGRNVLVTGASRGIGRDVAKELLGMGANVIAHSRSGPGALRDATGKVGGSLKYVAADLSTREGVERVASFVEGCCTELHGLVNNAGIYSGLALGEETFDNWDLTVNTNLRAPFFLARLLRERLRAGKGSVVNISSIMGLSASAGAYPYQASKSALIHITRALSLELAPDVRVNCVAPGFIMTDMNKEGWNDASFRKEVEERTPLGRWGRPEDISSAVCFLLSERASFITGETILVDGGKSLF